MKFCATQPSLFWKEDVLLMHLSTGKDAYRKLPSPSFSAHLYLPGRRCLRHSALRGPSSRMPPRVPLCPGEQSHHPSLSGIGFVESGFTGYC